MCRGYKLLAGATAERNAKNDKTKGKD